MTRLVLKLALWAVVACETVDVDLVYGRRDPPFGTPTTIALWSGQNAESGEGINWVRTLAHEAGHFLDPNYQLSHNTIIARANYCAGL